MANQLAYLPNSLISPICSANQITLSDSLRSDTSDSLIRFAKFAHRKLSLCIFVVVSDAEDICHSNATKVGKDK